MFSGENVPFCMNWIHFLFPEICDFPQDEASEGFAAISEPAICEHPDTWNFHVGVEKCFVYSNCSSAFPTNHIKCSFHGLLLKRTYVTFLVDVFLVQEFKSKNCQDFDTKAHREDGLIRAFL